MRRALAALQGQRVHLTATVHRFSSGHVLLRNISLPVGGCRYVWVPAGQWRAGAVPKGRRLDLVATVLPYWRATDDTKDFGLTEVVLP